MHHVLTSVQARNSRYPAMVLLRRRQHCYVTRAVRLPENVDNRAVRRPPAPDESDPRYIRAREAYLRLLREGRLSCRTCPLFAVGGCTSMCW